MAATGVEPLGVGSACLLRSKELAVLGPVLAVLGPATEAVTAGPGAAVAPLLTTPELVGPSVTGKVTVPVP